QSIECGRPVADRHDRQAPRRELLLQDGPIGFVVVDHEDAQAWRLGQRGWRLDGLRGLRGDRALQAYGEPERAPAAELAFEANLATHLLDRAFADGRAEPRPAELARHRYVSLRERLEQAAGDFWRNADAGVGHVESDQRGVLCLLSQPRVDCHFAV